MLGFAALGYHLYYFIHSLQVVDTD
jgi:hypothetical protein